MISDFIFIHEGSSLHLWPDACLALLVGCPLTSMLFLALPRSKRAAQPLVATLGIGVAFALSLVLCSLSVAAPALHDDLFSFDRLSSLMAALVSGIAFVVHAFSLRYLDGDSRYEQFFVGLSGLSSTVLLLVTTNNLLLLAVAWWLVSQQLCSLQQHEEHRPQAIAAARGMRQAHLYGDVGCTLGAVVLMLAGHSMRLDLAVAQLCVTNSPWTSLALAGFAVAACSKAAQIPLHRWLPDTMEAPTPVSALMHAGVVNAGGLLLTRLAPLLVHAWPVTLALFCVGAISALWGSACMLVRSEIKRKLAYSTMGQMGYMVMQCSLGAGSAAILHLIAHGIFKANLFLGSGSAIGAHAHHRAPRHQPWIAASVGLASGVFGWLVWVVLQQHELAPKSWVVFAFATATCMHMSRTLVQRGTREEIVLACIVTLVALPSYALGLSWFEHFLARDLSQIPCPIPNSMIWLMLLGFGLALLSAWGIVPWPQAWRDRLYVSLLHEGHPPA